MPNTFLTRVIIVKAKMATTIPAIPHIKAPLACLTFSASPIAVRKRMPAIIKQITAMIVKTIHKAFTIETPILKKLKLVFCIPPI